MPSPPLVVQVLVVEPDQDVARAVARLAFDTLDQDAPILIGVASTLDGARGMIDHAVQRQGSRLILLAAPHLADGANGLEIIDHASRVHEDTRVILLTNGERDELLHALRLGVDGVVTKPIELPALRSILRYVAEEPARRSVRPAVKEADGFTLFQARAAIEAALDAVDLAEERLRRVDATAPPGTQRAVREARQLAIAAHRRVLEAERELSRSEPTMN